VNYIVDKQRSQPSQARIATDENIYFFMISIHHFNAFMAACTDSMYNVTLSWAYMQFATFYGLMIVNRLVDRVFNARIIFCHLTMVSFACRMLHFPVHASYKASLIAKVLHL